MQPAFSVIFLTTLIGAAQGLFLGLFAAEAAQVLLPGTVDAGPGFYVAGSLIVLVFGTLGGIASMFHLGRPERAWRALSMWRTSWLSREGIALPAFLAVTVLYGALHWAQVGPTLVVGAIGTLLAIALFVCTGMIYACIRFLQEWASPLTVINYLVLGCASGFTLAAAYAALAGHGPVQAYGRAAIAFTTLGLLTRLASLWRNARLKPRSTLQSATGIHHPRIVQITQGFTGGSYNTRAFFHHCTALALRRMRWIFLLGAFVLPLALLAIGTAQRETAALVLAFLVQYAGLIAERWFFFAQARHPQNLYYQAIS